MKSLLLISLILQFCAGATLAQAAFPRATKFAVPVYPEAARAVRAEDSVVVALEVSKDGKVEGAVAQSGHPLFRQAAVNAALQWEFASLPGNHFISLTFAFKINVDRKSRPAERQGDYKLNVSAPAVLIDPVRVN